MGASAETRVSPLRRWSRLTLPGGNRTAWALTLLVCVAWTLALAAGYGGWSRVAGTAAYWILLMGPAAALLAVLLWHPHSPPQAKLVLAWLLTVACAIGAFSVIGTRTVYGLAPVALALAAIAARRWPVPTLVFVFALAGSANSIDAFLGISARPLSDLALAGCWGALLIGWLGGRRRGSVVMPISLLLLTAYLLVSLVSVLGVANFTQGVQAFRFSCWTMAAVLAVALLLEERRQRIVAHRVLLVLAMLGAGYAMLRWAIGPAGAEEDIVRRGGPYVLFDDGGEVRLFGALPGPFVLGVWAAAMVPFCLASALAPIGTAWRLVAGAGALMAGLAIGPAGSRASMAGAAVGMLTVLALLALGRGFRGRRALSLALGAILVVSGGGAFVAAKLADEGPAGQRFRGLLNPTEDYSVQDRLVKWRTILADIDDYPMGHGLGSSGEAEVRYARFASPATFSPDSSFVKVAYDQGIVVLILFVCVLLALLAHLARQALTRTDPLEAGMAMAACATLVSFATVATTGDYSEQLAAVSVWLIIGLAMAGSIHVPERLRGRRPR